MREALTKYLGCESSTMQYADELDIDDVSKDELLE